MVLATRVCKNHSPVFIYEKWPCRLERVLLLGLLPPTLWVTQGAGEKSRTYFELLLCATLNARHISKHLTFPSSRPS